MELRYFLLYVCIASAATYRGSNDVSRRLKIVGGRFTPIEDVPYMAGIMLTSWFYSPYNPKVPFKSTITICGGTIIQYSWILTAAHCFNKNAKDIFKGATVIDSQYFVGTGSNHDNYSDGTIHEVSLIVKHPNYKNITEDNDIALVRLKYSINFNKRQKSIDIPHWTEGPQENQQVQISGYGNERYRGQPTTRLKTANVTVADQKTCVEIYKHYSDLNRGVTDNMFCASGDGKTDACQGDSGGPAIINNKVHGIISWGYNCADLDYPGVYTRVQKYFYWINEILINLDRGRENGNAL